MARETYLAQVHLLMRLLPVVSTEPAFALKGGTAINLFHRDMPRLSVDIDLAYLPIEDRATSLNAIDAAYDRITSQINKLPGASAQRIAGGGAGDTRILANADGVTVKIETSPVMRGAFMGFGHHHVGLTGGPKTGRMIAQMISGRTPNFDVAPYAPSRFQSG